MPAGFVRRTFAFLVDATLGLVGLLVIEVVLLVLVDVAIGLMGLQVTSGIVTVALWSGLAAAIVAYGAYVVALQASGSQATLGQRLARISVTDLSGRRLKPGRALVRLLAQLLTFATCGIGLIPMAFSGRRQTLHDRLAGTLVVRGSPPRQPADVGLGAEAEPVESSVTKSGSSSSKTTATWTLFVVCVVVFVVEVATAGDLGFVFGQGKVGLVLALGAVIPSYVLQGEIWRLFTAGFLQFDIFHIAFNMIALVYVGRWCEPRFGTRRFLAVFSAALVCGDIAALLPTIASH